MEPPRHGEESSSDALAASHTPEAIRARLRAGPRYSYLRDFVYGAVDGTITTFAVVAGIAGAGLTDGVVVVLGLASLVADGLSMAASNFLGARAEAELRERARHTEVAHVELHPRGEREEIRQIFEGKGFSGDALDRAVEIITADRERWIQTMLVEEFGLSPVGPSPWRAGIATFAAFLGAGVLPLLAYLWNVVAAGSVGRPFLWSALLAGLGFFGVGALKGRFVQRSGWLAGLETLAIGGLAAAVAYGIGAGLEGLARAF